MAEQLKEHSIECRFYHGSLSTEGTARTTRFVGAHEFSAVAAFPSSVVAGYLICAVAERTDVHYAFLSGVVRVVVATVAFGMGYTALHRRSSTKSH
jgi:hypothetical protein